MSPELSLRLLIGLRGKETQQCVITRCASMVQRLRDCEFLQQSVTHVPHKRQMS
jgi:hypothetical protein